MDWVTAIWAMLIGGCVAMALPHLLIGIWQRRGAHLFFVLAAAAVIGIAICETLMMRAGTVDQFARAQQWTHVPIFFLVVALVGFVRLYFHTGRLWLGMIACAVRFLSLIINFAFPPSLNFREITALRHLHFMGEIVSVPVGVSSPWTRLGELSSLLLLVFVIDASISLWRQGRVENRRRALVVGVSIAFFILLAAGVTALIHRHIIDAPYLVSFPFAAILVAMAFELGSDLLRARQVKEKLEISEASLHESEKRFRIAADAAPVLIWMSGPDKLCTFFNKGWLDFTGRTMEQELGNGWSEGVHPDDLQKCLETYVSAFDARKPFAMQYRLRHRDGQHRWVSDHGVPRHNAQGIFTGYIGACLDLTELLKREEELRQFEERVTLAADMARFGVWEMDVSTQTMWMSDSARSLFQFEPGTVITHKVFQERVHPEDRAFRDAAVEQAMEKQGGYELEYRAMLPDGTVRWIAGRSRCVKDASGNFSRLIGVWADVTARKVAEKEERRRREEMSRLSRITLLGEMSASIAHEVNQPLSGIMSNASAGQRFIDRGDADISLLREILVDIAADGRRAHDVIRNVRNTMKKGATVREPIDLNFVVMKVARMLQPDIARNFCELETSLAKDLPMIEADPVQMHQVLINLVSNALDAMRDTPASHRKVQVATERDGNASIRVSVRDYGTGIPDGVREQLFEQFFTTKEEGLGMGLTIVRSIIEAHAGAIAAENVDGGGARFYFTLPVAETSSQ
jgi:two-component system, LuxR family, sensor kinase FixL